MAFEFKLLPYNGGRMDDKDDNEAKVVEEEGPGGGYIFIKRNEYLCREKKLMKQGELSVVRLNSCLSVYL